MNINVRLTVGDLIAALRRAALHKADARTGQVADQASSNRDDRR